MAKEYRPYFSSTPKEEVKEAVTKKETKAKIKKILDESEQKTE